nr:unnamed protein product [Callosobruchus chinensis]
MNKRKRHVLLIVFIVISLYLIYQHHVATRTKYILYWTKMFDRDDFNFGFGREIFRSCPISSCFATNNRSLRPIEDFDAILFHGVEYLQEGKYGRPEKRSRNQVYVFVSQESESNTPIYENFDGFYNWTMTYRLDSDIVRPYGYIKPLLPSQKPPDLPSVQEIEARPKKIAWMVSNCDSESQRENLVKKIDKYIPVDIYGNCGTHFCSKETSDACYDLIEANYKFYLSFENSYCIDYVTEKMFNVLKKNVIPIVYGGANYTALAPPHSVIDVSEFETVKELTDYLKELDEDPEEYLKYFEWKKRYSVTTSSQQTLCELCEKLHQPIGSKIYASFKQWWTDSGCKYKNNLPNIVSKDV